MFTRENLERSLLTIGAPPTSKIFDDLKTAYTSPERHYHTDMHVSECLSRLDTLRASAVRPAEIEVAFWFHDAVYDTRRSDSEECSADWARRFLESVGAPAEVVDRVATLILATKAHRALDIDAQIMLDIDLAILGTPADVFETYDAAIRREYHWVPESEYRAGRARILTSFLERTRIYNTELLGERCEERARTNLKRKIAELLARDEG